MHFPPKEPGLYRRLMTLALPLILQNLITTALGFVDTFMVGLLGNAPMAAVTAANAPMFLMQIIILGLISSLTVLASQYWGSGNLDAINRSMGVFLYTGLFLSATMALTTLFAPAAVLGLVTNNPNLIPLGTPYLRIVGLAYVFNSVSSVYVGMQQATENPKFGMWVFGLSVVVNTFLNYCLIFGHFGAPRMGITGAAIATLTSRIIEFVIVFSFAVRGYRIPLKPKALFQPGKFILQKAVTYGTPIMINEFLWGLGTTMMTVILGHMVQSTEMLAAFAIMGNIDRFSTVACFGLAGAGAILIGIRIGQGRSPNEVYALGLRLLLLAFLLGLLIAGILAIALPTFFIPVLYPLFRLSPEATHIATVMCIVYLATMPARTFDVTSIVGILRAGGDAAISSIIDLGPLWGIAIPLTALTGLVLHTPIVWVCLAMQAENFFKLPLSVHRFRSKKWIHYITKEAAS